MHQPPENPIEALKNLQMNHPDYQLRYELQMSGPSHAPTQSCIYYLADEKIGEGYGATRQEAKKEAAKEAWMKLKQREYIS